MHVLIAGWFSFEGMGNTAGDMIARDVVCKWLVEANITYEIAVADAFPYPGGVNWEKADASLYTDLVFVCGPFGNGWPVTVLLEKFSHCRLTGVNLSLMESLEQWNPFTFLYERDSSAAANPDITFYGPPPAVPVVGVILIGKQDEYGNRDMHKMANEFIRRLINNHEMSVVHIDTVLENNATGFRTPGEIESIISRMDLVITTRLHGTVLALKNNVPVIPLDSVAGGAKVTRQVKTLGWPLLFNTDDLDDAALSEAFRWCLTTEARMEARACAKKAVELINETRIKFISELTSLAKEVDNG